MGGRSGGLTAGDRGGMNPGDATFKGEIKNVESLKNIKDPQLYKEVKAAISRFAKEFGIPNKNVKLADMPMKYAGVHVTDGNGKSEGL